MSSDLPTLAFFRAVDAGLPAFVRLHQQQHVDCLARSFRVVVIDTDCDYGQVCDRYQPDLALFESGVYAGRQTIMNTTAHPDVPKLGLLHADGYCASRTVFLSDMERWGVEDFVTTSVAMGEYTPELADRLFVWPNFIDPDMFRDYGLAKTIPVYLTGSQAVHYPWRHRIARMLAARYPTRTAPHLGWFDKKADRMVHGEEYARMLNAAQVVPACGTIANEVVRKHFEVPGARCCLVAERTAALEAAGFVDMVNCVFADANTVVDKLDHLFAHPDELAAITDAGYALVHARHTAAQRDEIRQWYDRTRELRPDERIVQRGPFAPLETVARDSGVTNVHVISGGRDRELLARAAAAIEDGRYAAAERLYLRCLNYHPMSEALLGVARCCLLQGDAPDALEHLIRLLQWTLYSYADDPTPDAVEWAYFIRAQICDGKPERAVRFARRYSGLQHHELARMRFVAAALSGDPSAVVVSGPSRPSVHQLPERPFGVWRDELVQTLRNCGQQATANKVAALSPRTVESAKIVAQPAAGGEADSLPLRWFPRRVRRRALAELNRLRRRPRPDAQSELLMSLVTKHEVRTAIVESRSLRGRAAQSLLAGLRANPGGPRLLWLGGRRADVTTFELGRHGLCRLPDSTVPLETARRGNILEPAELIAVLSPEDGVHLTRDEIGAASLVVLDHVETRAGSRLREQSRG